MSGGREVVYQTDEQWNKIKPLIPRPTPRPQEGRPKGDDRFPFEAILRVPEDMWRAFLSEVDHNCILD